MSPEQDKLKPSLGLKPDQLLLAERKLPVTAKLKRLYAQLRTLHSKVARQRKDLYHKLTEWLAGEFNRAAMTRRAEKKVDATTRASHTKQI